MVRAAAVAGLAAVAAVAVGLAPSAATAAPAPPSAEVCAHERAARTLPPIQALDPHPGAPRFFAMQFKQELRHVTTYAAFRTKVECAIRDVVVPRLAPGRPNVVAFNEDIGLMTIATGSRGAAARALFADPRSAPSCESQGLPCGAAAALGAISAAYAQPLAAYHLRFPGLQPISGTFVAATDTFARGFMQTFSDLARRYGIYVLGSNDQAPFRESTDPGDIATFRDPDEPVPASVYVATDDKVYNEVFLWGPHDVRHDGPGPLRNVVASNRKVPLTPIEHEFQFTDGPATGPEAVANLRPYRLPGTHARIGFATSLPAFTWGDGSDRPAPGRECDDVSVTYMRCLDALGANVVVQDEANPGRWAADSGCNGACWQPLEWMKSGWRTVADHDARFAYNVTPMLVGNLADLPFDGQSSITQRGLGDRACAYVGDSAFQAGDPDSLRGYSGPKHGFLALAPWVTPDGPRDALRAAGARLAPGSGDGLENDYLETAIVADLPLPPDAARGGCVTAPDAAAPVTSLRAPRYASDTSTSSRFEVLAGGADAGSGVATVTLEARRLDLPGASWHRVSRSAPGLVAISGRQGATYALGAVATDRAGNAGSAVAASVVVPLDQSARALRYSRRGWRRERRATAYGGTVAAGRPGARMTLRFRGRGVALIGSAAGGRRARIVLDGRALAPRLGGRGPRAELWRSPLLGPGRHRLSVTVGSGGLALDAVAVVA